jgi:DNA-binding beta-propeller fold protein YncE
LKTQKESPTVFTHKFRPRHAATGLVLLATATCFSFAQHRQYNADDAFLPSPVRSASTMPTKGDVNPYGVAFIKNNFQTGSGPLKHGDILVSNFNNAQNLQGTGTTIVRIPASGSPSLFFQGAAPLGLSTGLGTLQYGFVLVANLPTADGTSATAQAGSLLVINNQGKLIQTITSTQIDGPWDMTVVDEGDRAIVFFSNAINGTVSRIDFSVSATGLTKLNHYTIASGYMHQGDPAALFDAPTGLVFDKETDRLYVASTLDNAVFVVRDAKRRTTSNGPGDIIYQDNTHLHGALAMAEAPNGHLLVTNNDVINSDPNQPSEIVEFTKWGQFVKEIPVDPNQGGSFGLAVNKVNDDTAILAAVDDNTVSITIWTLPLN